MTKEGGHMITENILQFDEFMRSVAQNSNTRYSFLLGAGASVESGLPSAQECIWDWKRFYNLYLYFLGRENHA